jgi:hypothetical protein
MIEPTEILGQLSLWARKQEARIMRDGRPIPSFWVDYAKQAGVQHPTKIHILEVERIELPPFTLIRYLAKQMKLPVNEIQGITFGHGVKMLEKRKKDVELFIHECVHVAQYEQLGFEKFLKTYILECIEFGYYKAPLEIEANLITERICGK